MKLFGSILPNEHDLALKLPGDDMIPGIEAIDSAFTLPASPEVVYPWFVQLGKQRAGWYFTRHVEPLFFPSARGIRYIEPKWQSLTVGQRIPDYGGKNGYLECFYLVKNKAIGYTSSRGKLRMTWVLTFWPVTAGTRVVIRLKIKGPITNNPFLSKAGKLFDRLTIMWLAAGLKERLR